MEQFKNKVYIQIKAEFYVPFNLVMALVYFLHGNQHFYLLPLSIVDILPNSGHTAAFKVFQSCPT